MVEEKNNPNEPKNSGVALLDKEEVKEENKEKNSTIEEDIEIKEDTDTGKGEEENIQQIDKKSKVGIIIFIVSIVIVLLGISSTIFAIINSNSTKIVKGATHEKEKNYKKGINCATNYSYNHNISNYRNRKLFC